MLTALNNPSYLVGIIGGATLNIESTTFGQTTTMGGRAARHRVEVPGQLLGTDASGCWALRGRVAPIRKSGLRRSAQKSRNTQNRKRPTSFRACRDDRNWRLRWNAKAAKAAEKILCSLRALRPLRSIVKLSDCLVGGQRMSHSRILTMCLALGLAGLMSGHWPMAEPAAQSEAAVRTERWATLGIEVHELVLDNGFRILLVEDHRIPRVAASLWYRFGGLQEPHGEHGEAHFLEHAIHQGTTSVGIRDRDLDRRLLRAIHDTEQELLAERNAQRNLLRERNVFFDEGEWPTTDRMEQPAQEALRAGGRAVEEPDLLGGVQLVPAERRDHAPYRSRAREHRQRAHEDRSRSAEGTHRDVLPARGRSHGQCRDSRAGKRSATQSSSSSSSSSATKPAGFQRPSTG